MGNRRLDKVNLGIGVVLAVVVVTLLVAALVGRQAGCEQVAIEDRGFIVVELETGEHVPARLGFETYEVVGDESLDDGHLAGAIEWITNYTGVQRLRGRVDPERYRDYMDGPESRRVGLVLVTVEEIPGSHSCGGETVVRWDRGTGHVVYSTVRLAAAHTYDIEHYQAALRHELLHALGLDDDPDSIDLNSIMSRTLLVYGEITAHDAELLQRPVTKGR